MPRHDAGGDCSAPDFGERNAVVVQDVSHCDRARLAILHDLYEVLDCAHAAARNYGDAGHARDGPREIDVEPFARTFAVDGGNENLASAEVDCALNPLDDVEARVLASVVGEGFPADARGIALGLDGEDHALGAEA